MAPKKNTRKLVTSSHLIIFIFIQQIMNKKAFDLYWISDMWPNVINVSECEHLNLHTQSCFFKSWKSHSDHVTCVCVCVWGIVRWHVHFFCIIFYKIMRKRWMFRTPRSCSHFVPFLFNNNNKKNVYATEMSWITWPDRWCNHGDTGSSWKPHYMFWSA